MTIKSVWLSFAFCAHSRMFSSGECSLQESNNPTNLTKATMQALMDLQDAVSVANKRGLTIKEVFN